VVDDNPGRLLQRRDKEGKVGYEVRLGEMGGRMWGRLPSGAGESEDGGVDSDEDGATPMPMSRQKEQGVRGREE
jgi:hypothetical protein